MAARPGPERAAAADGGSLVARLRAVHVAMVEAVLPGEGLGRVAELAAGAAGAPVAVVLPRLGAVAVSPGARGVEPSALRGYVAARTRGRPAPVPAGVLAEVPVASGDSLVGAVLLLDGGAPGREATEFLQLAAVACLTEVAVQEARSETEENLRGSLLEELRSRRDLSPREAMGGRGAWAAT